MNNPGKRSSFSDREVDEQQQQQQSSDDSSLPVSDGGADEVSSPAEVSGGYVTNRRRSGGGIGLAERLTDLFVGDGDGDGDLLMQRNANEGTVVQWLQALDMQVMGACRADERLKPLLKLNVSSVAEDRLLSHLSQHFEPSEVGLLARCLCIPLVSVRVGKINKQGTLLVPTSTSYETILGSSGKMEKHVLCITQLLDAYYIHVFHCDRGNLVLSLLPTSDLRISFLADDGYAERLSILRNISDCSSVVIEGIPADSSGRSFAIRVPNRDPFYFWCSEKSRLLGNELLEKMKNLLDRKPSLAELTGISNSRLHRFVDHLRTYLVGPIPLDSDTILVSTTPASNTNAAEATQTPNSPSMASKPSRVRSCSLSPRPSSFKEGPPRSLASLRNVVREKLRRKGSEKQQQQQPVPSLSTGEPSSLNNHEKDKLPESSTPPETCLFPPLSGLEPGKAVDMPSLSAAPQIPPIAASSLFSPYYCWCPPVVSTLQYTVAPLHTTSTAESFTLPPFSALLSGSAPRSSSPIPNLSEIPPFLPLSMPSSQQIPMFMCDPIVHVPVIDICSSGQAYLVSASPAMSVSIPPLVQESESEKSARDTLRLLISGSSQFPSVLANTDAAGGSRGFYGGTTDVNAIANSIAAMGLGPPGVMRRCIGQGDLVDLLKEPDEDEEGSTE
ncbi:hypothetical protein OSB04_017480 [Centaurea solstitialis]|uniref:Flocculation protein n=1 Tax=Centaurea solstitialis TaxID=347529 RepID=A0AA38TEV5_9ASTR|nr:hypothetical protein OSB04_017480 [Centaurea solstitialis]